MDLSPMNLIMDLAFSSIGYIYYRYGRKQTRTVFFLSGIGMMVYPYFVSSLWATIGIGAALGALPFVLVI